MDLFSCLKLCRWFLRLWFFYVWFPGAWFSGCLGDRNKGVEMGGVGGRLVGVVGKGVVMGS